MIFCRDLKKNSITVLFSHEYSANNVFVIFLSLIFCRGLKKEQQVLLTHGDSISKLADGFKAVAHSGKIVAGKKCFD